MASIVAYERDRVGLRAAEVHENGKIVRLVRVDNESLDSPANTADALRAALPEVRWSRVRLVAVLSSSQVRCRLLKLPPAPENELPDLVRMQAAREFATGEAQGVVDFVPLSGDESTQRSALVATVDAGQLTFAKQVAQQLEATLERVVARGAAAASLAVRAFPELGSGNHLVVAAAVDSLDLTVLQAGCPSLLRTTRLAQEAEPQAVTSESRRTSAMAAQQLGQRVDSTVYLGLSAPPSRSQPAALDLPLKLTQSFGLPVEQAELAGVLSGVIGAAIDQTEQARPAFDFLSPRQPVQDNSQQRRQVVLAVATAATVLLGIGWAWMRLSNLESQVESAQKLLNAERQAVENDAPVRAQAAAIEQWRATDFNWLEELDRLGQRMRPARLDAKDFPANQDVYLRQLTASRVVMRGESAGRIDLQTLSRSAAEFDEVEARLRDDRHQVETSVGSAATDAGKYTWATQTALRVLSATEEAAP